MWEAIQKLWEVIKDPDNRAVLSLLGGGAVVAAGGIWAVVKFFASHKTYRARFKQPCPGRISWTRQDAQIRGLERSERRFDEISARRAKIRTRRRARSRQSARRSDRSRKGRPKAIPRLQQALELLKADKIAEASQLLRAFAEDKTARIEQDRKEAAIAYRNLGAIAGLGDPKRALEAYEKAVALDPDTLVPGIIGPRNGL